MNFKSIPFIKPLVFFLVSFLAFAGFPFGFSKNAVAEVGKGDIVGVVFQGVVFQMGAEEVEITWPRVLQQYRPVVGAEVKAINTETGETYISNKTDKYGIYKIEGIPVGEYNIGVSTDDGDFISNIVVKVEPNKQTAVPLMLKKKEGVGILGIVIPIASGAALGYLVYKVYASPCIPCPPGS